MIPLFSNGFLVSRDIAISILLSALILVVTAAFIVIVSDYHHGWKRRRFLGAIPLMDDESYFSPRLRLGRSTYNYYEGFVRGYNEVGFPIDVFLRFYYTYYW